MSIQWHLCRRQYNGIDRKAAAIIVPYLESCPGCYWFSTRSNTLLESWIPHFIYLRARSSFNKPSMEMECSLPAASSQGTSGSELASEMKYIHSSVPLKHIYK
ncbi:hypothetical protein V6N11_023261 [Hibiscus sabdariffa]|uniref:Uncharacterized protein n=1 Tax=Hibiscus sabdariffa TaxID=183260 RepID=A0ABR2TM10_9ROSI